MIEGTLFYLTKYTFMPKIVVFFLGVFLTWIWRHSWVHHGGNEMQI